MSTVSYGDSVVLIIRFLADAVDVLRIEIHVVHFHNFKTRLLAGIGSSIESGRLKRAPRRRQKYGVTMMRAFRRALVYD